MIPPQTYCEWTINGLSGSVKLKFRDNESGFVSFSSGLKLLTKEYSWYTYTFFEDETGGTMAADLGAHSAEASLLTYDIPASRYFTDGYKYEFWALQWGNNVYPNSLLSQLSDLCGNGTPAAAVCLATCYRTPNEDMSILGCYNGSCSA